LQLEENTTVVALRTPNDLLPPEPDGWPTRTIKEHGNDKLFYWASYLHAFSIATKDDWAGRRSCLDLFASYGINRDEKGERSWGSALLSLLVPPYPFDTYVFADQNPRATNVLAKRVEALGIPGLEIFPISLHAAAGPFEEARRVKAAKPRGPKVVILTGDANDAPLVARQCLPAFSGQRVSLAFIDPPGAHFTWKALVDLTAYERMDLLLLFPEDMDIERNLKEPSSVDRLNSYFGSTRWQTLRDEPGNRGQAARQRYESQLQGLGYKLGYVKTVRHSGNAPIYRLIFGSKSTLGIKIWNESCQEPDGQYGMYLGPDL
jgi:three-Cys-motif partner protein